MSENTWQTLCALEFEDIARTEQALLFDAGRVFSRELQHNEGVPHQVFQYWNDTPDDQVFRLLERTRKWCEGDGIRWQLFDETSAAEFLKDKFGDRYEAAFTNVCITHSVAISSGTVIFSRKVVCGWMPIWH